MPQKVPAETIRSVVLVTTTTGATIVDSTLRSALERMRSAYPNTRDRIPDPDAIRVAALKGVTGIRTPEESAAISDLIHAEIQGLTADGQPRLVVLIAGGRRTLSYYAGVALSLLAAPATDSVTSAGLSQRSARSSSPRITARQRERILDRDAL